MRLIEALKARSARNEEKRAQAMKQEQAMKQVETFVGTKEEYEELKREQYDYVDVPGKDKFIDGLLNRHLGPMPVAGRGTLGGGISWYSFDSIFKKAVELGADAIVRYQEAPNGYPFMRGIPVKRHQEPQNPESPLGR